MAEEKKDLVSLDFDFAPEWARQSPEEARRRFTRNAYHDAESERDTREGRGRNNDRGGRGESGGPRDRLPRERPPRAERRDHRREENRGGFDRAERRPRDERGAAHFARREQNAEPRGPQAAREERPAHAHGGAAGERQHDFRPPAEPLPFDLRLLPEQKALGSIIRRIQTTHRAYPLRDIARLFLDNPAAALMRIELNKDQPADVRVYQCKICSLPALSHEEIAAHIAAAHLDHFFDIADIEGEAPSGNFPCVARCGFSGELLGPPNHHSYATKVQEMLRTRYAHKSPDDYRARIEVIRDPELVEQWREQAKKRRIYRLKEAAPAAAAANAETVATADAGASAAPAAPPLERDAAERLLMREIVPQQISATRSLVATIEVARRTPSAQIARALNDALFREKSFPALLFFALRGAFRHRKLHLFKVNDPRGPDFVMLSKPEALDTSYVTEELRAICGHINDHPGTTRQELLGAIAQEDAAKQQSVATSLNWLVERGNVIEYYNGVLSAPAEHPSFRYLPGERGGGRDQGTRPRAGTPAAADLAIIAGSTAEEVAAAASAGAQTPAAETPAEITATATLPEAAPDAAAL